MIGIVTTQTEKVPTTMYFVVRITSSTPCWSLHLQSDVIPCDEGQSYLVGINHWIRNKQVRIHESTVACDWAGAVMPENHEKNKILDILDIFENLTFLKILEKKNQKKKKSKKK